VDVLKSLQATLHYYEHVANKETPERAGAIVTQTQKLRKIIARIENELESESGLYWHLKEVIAPPQHLQLSKPRRMI
jgi:hypothetical protein